MTRRCFAAILLSAMLAVTLSAHEKFRIVGAIVKVHATQVDVEAVDGATYEIDMDDTTHVMRELKRVPQSELRTGQRVVVDALGHDMFDLQAVLITLQK